MASMSSVLDPCGCCCCSSSSSSCPDPSAAGWYCCQFGDSNYICQYFDCGPDLLQRCRVGGPYPTQEECEENCAPLTFAMVGPDLLAEAAELGLDPDLAILPPG